MITRYDHTTRERDMERVSTMVEDATGVYVTYDDHMAALAEAKGSGWVACSERMPPVCRSTHMGNDASAEVVTVGPCGMCGMVYVEYVSNEGGLSGEWYVVDPDGSMDRTGEKYTPTHWLAVPPLPAAEARWIPVTITARWTWPNGTTYVLPEVLLQPTPRPYSVDQPLPAEDGGGVLMVREVV